MRSGIENSNSMIQDVLVVLPDALLTSALIEKESPLNRDYIGIVVDNNDPDKLGKCKIRVFGVFDEVADKDLPWAAGEQEFIGGLKGSFIVPPVGCIVAVGFENGDIYFPEYSRKVINSRSLPTNASKNYPNNMIFFETDHGTAFEIDRTNDEVTFVHKSGMKVKFVIDGDSGKITGNMDELDLTMTGETNIKATSVNATMTDKTTINATEVDITNTGITTFNATMVNVNHSGLWTDNGQAVIPSGMGPYCALPTCPYSGIPLQGQIIVGGGV